MVDGSFLGNGQVFGEQMLGYGEVGQMPDHSQLLCTDRLLKQIRNDGDLTPFRLHCCPVNSFANRPHRLTCLTNNNRNNIGPLTAVWLLSTKFEPQN